MESVFFEFPPLPQALERVANLSDEQFQAFRSAVIGSEGFESDYVRCKQLAGLLDKGLSVHDVSNILRSLGYLKNRLREWEATDVDAETALRELFEFIGLDKFVKEDVGYNIYRRLGEIFADNPSVESQFAARWLQTGIIDTAVDFDSFVDLRPRFSDDLTIEEFIPVVIFRAEVENDIGDVKSLVFQLTTGALDVLRAVLNSIDDQLTAVRANPALGMRQRIPMVGEEKERL